MLRLVYDNKKKSYEYKIDAVLQLDNTATLAIYFKDRDIIKSIEKFIIHYQDISEIFYISNMYLLNPRFYITIYKNHMATHVSFEDIWKSIFDEFLKHEGIL